MLCAEMGSRIFSIFSHELYIELDHNTSKKTWKRLNNYLGLFTLICADKKNIAQEMMRFSYHKKITEIMSDYTKLMPEGVFLTYVLIDCFTIFN